MVGLGYLPAAGTVGLGGLGFLPTSVSSQYEDFNLGLRALLTSPFGFSDPLVRGTAMALLFALLAAVLVWIARTSRPDAASLWRATARAAEAFLLLVPPAPHPSSLASGRPFLLFPPPPPFLFLSPP